MIAQDNQRTLLRAYPHPRFGGGKTHLLKEFPDEDGGQRTLCGKTLEMCPGEFCQGTFEDVDCKVCCNSAEVALKRAEQYARWQQNALERERQQQENSRQWWAAYEVYLQSPDWLEKRRLVLARCKSVCEGCGILRAVQVHHLCYPTGVLPGSREWIRAEKLFHLVALCLRCHEDLHP
jgi:hypothetical protein